MEDSSGVNYAQQTTQTFQNNPQFVSPPPPIPTSNKKKFFIIGTILFLVILTVIYLLVFKPKIGINNIGQEVKKEIVIPKYWVNCEDSRQVIEEADKLYVACLGGVLITDKNGNVIDQITMVDGLGDSVTTSIVKIGDIIYIGTQDGLTKFNLITRDVKKISVQQGLVNGSNIKLAQDGMTMWVATFDGVSRLNTVDDSIINYTSELDSQAEKRNIGDILVTDKYVFFLELASVYSSGAVVRYDKSTNTFKTFKPADFGLVDQYARLDFNTIAQYGNYVFVADNREMFVQDETTDANWNKISSITEFINSDQNTTFSILNLLKNQYSSGVLVSSGNKIYSYEPVSNTTGVFYDFGDSATSVGIKYTSMGDTLWYNKYNQNDIWLSSLNINSKQVSNYPLNNPKNFSGVTAVIDDDVFVSTNMGLYKYTLESDNFTKVYSSVNNSGDMTNPIFLPIPNSQNIFTYKQFCGQICEKPIINIYNYATGEVLEVIMPTEILELGSQDFDDLKTYAAFNIKWGDFVLNKIGFSYNDNGTNKFISYNYNTGEWQEEGAVPENVEMYDGYTSFCNRYYTFKNNNSFTEYHCSNNTTDGNIMWAISDGKIIETNVPTGESKTLILPALDPRYSPFESDNNIHTLKRVMYTEGYLWVSSDRGLIRYNPQDQTSKVYGPQDGLLSINVESFVVMSDKIWVVTSWGGLSVINK